MITLTDYELLESFGRAINIVGNAQSILERNDGSLIDKRPVVRFNWGERHSAASQGERFDFLVSYRAEAIANNSEHWPPDYHTFLSMRGSDKNALHRSNGENYSAHLADKKFYMISDYRWQISQRAVNRPTTGFIFLSLLDQLDYTGEVSLFGFDFKETRSLYERQLDPTQLQRERSYHNWNREKHIVSDLILRRNWRVY